MKTISELDGAELGWRSTDPSAPLDALVRRLSQMAEELFDRTGKVDMFWLVESPRGQIMIATQMVGPPGKAIETKEVLADGMREFFAKHGVTRYAQASECWFVIGPEPGAYRGSLASHPERREAVAVNADDGVEYLVAKRDIVRPEQGKPYLAKLKIERVDLDRHSGVGRFNNLSPISKVQKH
jgi:hypothetical protein